MPAGKERLAEIVDYAIGHTDKEACDAYSIPQETLNRYKREYRKHFGDSADLLMALKKQYTNEELKAIANGGRIVPGYKKAPIISFDGETIVWGLMSDTHIGSSFTEASFIFKALEEFEKQGCAFMAHAGDVCEGLMNRPGHVYELSHIGYKAQRDEAIRIFSQWKKPAYYISGNHDDSLNTKLGVGINIVEEMCKAVPNAVFLGNGEGDISINGVTIKLYHGLDMGGSYAVSYRNQKFIESLTGGEKPNVICSGHDHKSMYMFYRNMHSIASGCLQKQTSFMRGKRSAAHVGFWIVRMGVNKNGITWFSPTFYPYYQ